MTTIDCHLLRLTSGLSCLDGNHWWCHTQTATIDGVMLRSISLACEQLVNRSSEPEGAKDRLRPVCDTSLKLASIMQDEFLPKYRIDLCRLVSNKSAASHSVCTFRAH